MISWLSRNENRARLIRWAATFGAFAGVQLVVQLLNAGSGFLLVRSLEKPDYAWFTIASGMSAALSILSDSGIGSAVTSIGGEVWQDRASLKGLVETALRLRRSLAVIASIVVATISLWLLLRNGAGMHSALTLTALVLAPIWQISTTAIYSVVNRLQSRVRQLQVADLVPALTRILLTSAFVASGRITPVTALIAVLVAQVTQYWLVRQQVTPLFEGISASDVDTHTRRIWTTVRHLMPNCIFNCIQGQLTTWLISVFATTNEVADLGALSRLGILFAIFAGPVGHYVAPAFARANTQTRLWTVSILLIGGITSFSSGLLLVAHFRANWILTLLGNKYSHLHQELGLVLAGMAIASLSGLVWALNNARGWVRMSWLNIPLTIIVQAISASMLRLDSVVALAWFIIITATAQCGLAIITCFLGLAGHHKPTLKS